MKKCRCGKQINRYATECSYCFKARMSAVYEEAAAIVATGKCPGCGSALRRNLSLSGWYQCEQFGTERFRKDSSKPECNFQIFVREVK